MLYFVLIGLALSIVVSCLLKFKLHWPESVFGGIIMWFLLYFLFGAIFIFAGKYIIAFSPVLIFLIILPFLIITKKKTAKKMHSNIMKSANDLVKLTVMNLVKIEDAVRFLERTSAKQFLIDWQNYQKLSHPCNALTEEDLNQEE